MTTPEYTVGRLARASGVSVRTLHLYDARGLLRPTRLSPSGYRLYGEAALLRLQQIAALKTLGFTLAQIGGLLPPEAKVLNEAHWKVALELQLGALEREEARLAHLKKLLWTTLNALEISGEVRPEDIFMFIRAASSDAETRRQAWLHQTFSPEERAILEALPRLDADDARTREWAQLMRELRDALHLPPDSSAAQALAARVLELTDPYFEGNDALIEKYWAMVRPAPGEGPKVFGLDHELMDFIDAILEVHAQRNPPVNPLTNPEEAI